MQSGQDKFGMCTFNQSLFTNFMNKAITLEVALARSSNPDELQDMINRGGAASATPQRPPTTYTPAAKR
jgi:twitching motility protein PilT